MISTELMCDEPRHSMIRFYRASVVVFAMIGLLSGSALSLSAPIVVESRSTELKDRFQERVGAVKHNTRRMMSECSTTLGLDRQRPNTYT